MNPMNPMKDALGKRKGKSLDLTIMMGSPEEDKKDNSSDLAPKGSEMKDEAQEMGQEKSEDEKLMQLMSMLKDKPEAQSLVQELLSANQPDPSAMPSESDHEAFGKSVVSDMGDMEKSDLASRTKPRSLMERAKMDQLSKK